MKKFLKFLPLPPLTSLSLVLGVMIVSSCGTRKLGPYTVEEIQNNPYYVFFKAQSDRQMLQRISNSSFNLLRATYPEFLDDVQKNASKGALLDVLPKGLIHGDFHPQQMAWREGIAELDDWDTVKIGFLWQDIVRMESATRLLAHEAGLRGFPTDSCWNAYAHTFINGTPKTNGQPLQIQKEKEDDTPDFSKNPVWIKAQDESRIATELKDAINTWLDNNDLPIKSSAPKKRLVSGVGSLLKEKIIFLDPQQQLWELKEVETYGDGSKPCERYEKLSSVFEKMKKADAVSACWSWQGRSFTLLKWSVRYWSPSVKDFKTNAQLLNHTQWMCSELASFHNASLDEIEKRQWILALKSQSPLKQRISDLSETIFKNYQDAYRMILLD